MFKFVVICPLVKIILVSFVSPFVWTGYATYWSLHFGRIFAGCAFVLQWLVRFCLWSLILYFGYTLTFIYLFGECDSYINWCYVNCTTNVEGVIGQKLPILVMLYFIETPFPRLLPSFCCSANLRTMCSFYKYLVCRLCGYCLLLLLLDSCSYLLACADGIGLLLVLFSVGLSQHDDTFLILCLLCIFSLCGLLVSYSYLIWWASWTILIISVSWFMQS